MLLHFLYSDTINVGFTPVSLNCPENCLQWKKTLLIVLSAYPLCPMSRGYNSHFLSALLAKLKKKKTKLFTTYIAVINLATRQSCLSYF